MARRILVVSSNAGLKYSVDDKLDSTNDGFCHMHNGVDTTSATQDYPSISQINSKVMNTHINIIFASTPETQKAYSKLSQHIEGSSSGILSDDSSNVAELLRYEYNVSEVF